MSSDFSDGIELRAIAVASSKRSPTIPDAPTLAESGVKGAEGESNDLSRAGAPVEIRRYAAA